jgi:hypothetical protein
MTTDLQCRTHGSSSPDRSSGVDEVSFYAEVSTVGNTIDSHGGSRVRREKLWNNVHTMIALTALSMIIGVLPR